MKEIFDSAVNFHKQNNFEQAEKIYKKLLVENPNNYLVLGNLALLEIQLKRYPNAIDYLKKAIKVNANYEQGYCNLGKVYYLLSDIKKSIKYYKKTIKINPQSEDAHYNFGYVLHKIGDQKKAKIHFETSIFINPKNLDAQNNLGLVLTRLGQTEDAIIIFNKIIDNNSNFGKAYFNLYPLLIKNYDTTKALMCLEKAVSCSPQKIYYQIFLKILLEYSDKNIKYKKKFDTNAGLNNHNNALLDSWNYIKSKKTDKTKMISSTNNVLQLAKKYSKKNGLILEFGVRFGTSIRQIANIFSSHIHGFDSFEGLPESWHNIPQNFYSTFGKIPSTPKNVSLHVGLFNQSLPKFLNNHKDDIRFINIDCDIYSSTKKVLNLLSKQIVSGTIILFDEYFGNEHWRKDEFKAFQESVKKYNWSYEYIAFSVQTKQVLIKII